MASKSDSFNDRSRRALQLASQAALATGSDEVRTEHVLLGLLRGDTGFAAHLLMALGTDQASLEASVVSLLPPALDSNESRTLPFSPLVQRALDHARKEAAAFGQNEVGTSHLLLGLLKVGDGAAPKLLATVGITYDKAHDALRRIIDDLTSAESRLDRGRTVPKPARKASDADRGTSAPIADPKLIEQTKRQIRARFVEISTLVNRDIDAKEFFRRFLEAVISSLAAGGGAVWMLSDGGILEIQEQFCLPDVRLAEGPQDSRQRYLLLEKTLFDGESTVIAPRTGDGDGDRPGNPTDFLLVLGVLSLDLRPKGVVEIFQRPGAPATTQRGYLKFLIQMCELANNYLDHREARSD